jgi:hypothetical protein
MSFPNYFSYLPDVNYSVSVDKAGNESTIKIKDFFRLLKVRDDIFKDDTLYELYNVKNGERPEQICHTLYKDSRYYWILLQINGIVDYHNDWPLSTQELDAFILKKYGSYESSGATRHFETPEVRNSAGRLVLKEGTRVDEDFVYEYQDAPGQFVYKTVRPVPISYRKYEYRLNETKAQIQILNADFLIRYEEEVREYYRTARKVIKSSELDAYA